MSAKEHEYLCLSCGGRKQLFIERKPIKVMASIILLGVCFLAMGLLPETGIGIVMLPLGLALALAPAITLIKIRCLECEPEWRQRGIWGVNKQ
jgi:hypothetical protein